MSLLVPDVAGDTVRFDGAACRAAGESLRDRYVAASPFPHAVIDDFLPMELLRRVVEGFPPRREGRFANRQSNLKTGFLPVDIEAPVVINLLSALNSAEFLAFLEAMTGITELIPDPYYAGGGLHETASGGHLSIHADFNLHPQLALERRMNLILFLNEGWEPFYGGDLELWDRGMEACVTKVAPEMARAVVFNTDESSFHGHPDPLATPEGIYRRSIALYYYTVAERGAAVRKTTRFMSRPGTADRINRRARMQGILRELCPPLIARKLQRP